VKRRDRRTVLKSGIGAAVAAPALLTVAQAQPAPKTYVLVHGAWHGGWCWRDVAALLRAQGHRVTTPTQTGLGERRHLLSKGITLDTFIADIVNHIEAEELNDVILVGHSFAGSSISGTADRLGARIRHLVYLDSLIIQSGSIPFSILSPEVVASRRKLVAEQGQGLFLPVPAPSSFGIPEGHPGYDWVKRRMTPHPAGTFESPLHLSNPVGNGRPCTYIMCTNPVYAPLEGARQWARQQKGWGWREIASGHDAMVMAPEALARMLAQIG
jgi:pimeloyl-ACP methyl ester carboxylesterase